MSDHLPVIDYGGPSSPIHPPIKPSRRKQPWSEGKLVLVVLACLPLAFLLLCIAMVIAIGCGLVDPGL